MERFAIVADAVSGVEALLPWVLIIFPIAAYLLPGTTNQKKDRAVKVLALAIVFAVCIECGKIYLSAEYARKRS